MAGFLQGGCLATEFVARNPARYGALISFTGGLIGPPGTKFEYTGSLAGTPAFIAAGDPDPHVPWRRVEEPARVFNGLGGDVRLQRYPGMPHMISEDELKEAREVVRNVMTSELKTSL